MQTALVIRYMQIKTIIRYVAYSLYWLKWKTDQPNWLAGCGQWGLSYSMEIWVILLLKNINILRPNHSKEWLIWVYQKTCLRIFLKILFVVNIHSDIQIHKQKINPEKTNRLLWEIKQNKTTRMTSKNRWLNTF